MFVINFAFAVSWWDKDRGGVRVYAHPMSTTLQTCWHDKSIQRISSLPEHWIILVPNEALQGMTSGLSTAPFIWEHLLWFRGPKVLASDNTPGMNWQVICDSTQVQKHLFKNQSKAIYHSSLLSGVESISSNHLAINYINFHKSINNLSTIHEYILSIVSKHDY